MITGDDLALFDRSLRHAAGQYSGRALDAALEELGWSDALAEDRRVAVSLLFGIQGEANVASSALDWVLDDALGISGGVVWPAISSSAPPGSLVDRRLTVAGLGPALMAERESAVIVARAGVADVAVTVPVADLSLRRVSGIDPELGLIEVTGEVAAPGAHPPVTSWDEALARAQVAVAYELVGLSRKMLELALEHARTREQFGHPIGWFQAIRHRLADTLVAIEMAQAVLDAVWDDPTSAAASMAKALAGRGARTAARHCQQVLAGIGFTTEHPLHRYVRRSLVLDQLFGGSGPLTAELGRRLLADRRLPPPLAL